MRKVGKAMKQPKMLTDKYKAQLVELGITSPIKALYYFPKSVQYIEERLYTAEAQEGIFRGTALTKPTAFRTGRTVFSRFRFLTNGAELALICFNQAFLQKVIDIGTELVVVAKKSKNNWVVSKVYYKDLDNIGTESAYSLLKGMRQPKFRSYIEACLTELPVQNFLPDTIHQKYKMIPRKEAFQYMHFPQSDEEKKQAIRYFKYEEAFLFHLNLLLRKQTFQKIEKPKQKNIDRKYMVEIEQALPFSLTQAQKKVLEEIVKDFENDYIMHRLVQGDVGSGKTIVAIISAYLQIKAGYQIAFLAPTTILAEQHFKNTVSLLEHLGVSVAFLRSQTKKKERLAILDKLKNHEIDVIIGTHALLEADVQFANLGLAVIDEQQRFGVEQRKLLRKKAEAVDMLYMTATPIPRTLAMSVFGDLDVSTIDELPEGRQKITTRIVQKKHWENVLADIIATTDRAEQVYVVCPLIEESETLELGNLMAIFEQLKGELPTHLRIEMLHGKQKNEEKQEIIERFTKKEIDILVSTTVVEVGVHVDSATLMIIYDAQQFGLSQLHQLRGRVGRSSLASTCLLISDHKNKRLQAMTKSQDGFYLAQQDLELRGPGDFFGQKQSGIPTFRLLNLVEDYKILQVAKEDVVEILAKVLLEEIPEIDKIQQYIINKRDKMEELLD